MLQGVLTILAQLTVIVAGSILLLCPPTDNDTTTGKDAKPKETDMMILEMLLCDECNRPLTLGNEHHCPPKRFCLEGGCGTPFYSNDPARTLCITHAAYSGACNDTSAFAPGLLGVKAVQEALDIINENTIAFIKAYDTMLTRQESE